MRFTVISGETIAAFRVRTLSAFPGGIALAGLSSRPGGRLTAKGWNLNNRAGQTGITLTV